jgi:hypothetical protein
MTKKKENQKGKATKRAWKIVFLGNFSDQEPHEKSRKNMLFIQEFIR